MCQPHPWGLSGVITYPTTVHARPRLQQPGPQDKCSLEGQNQKGLPLQGGLGLVWNADGKRTCVWGRPVAQFLLCDPVYSLVSLVAQCTHLHQNWGAGGPPLRPYLAAHSSKGHRALGRRDPGSGGQAQCQEGACSGSEAHTPGGQPAENGCSNPLRTQGGAEAQRPRDEAAWPPHTGCSPGAGVQEGGRGSGQ